MHPPESGLPLVIDLPADNYTELAGKSGTAGFSRLPQHMQHWFCLAFDMVEYFGNFAMKNACFVSSESRDDSSQKPSLFSCLRPAQEMQQILGLEDGGRRMVVGGCACAVSDGSGQRPPALSWQRRPWPGAPGGQTDVVVLLDVYP